VDVTDVRAGAPVKDIIDPTSEWIATPHPPSPAAISDERTRAAMA
jgi:hypothetical protein